MDCVTYPRWGYPVAKETAQHIHSKLGEEKWRQLLDGKFHKYGKMVFDQGLHKEEHPEPGYLANMLAAHQYSNEHIGEKSTIQNYYAVHKIACAHFKKELNIPVWSKYKPSEVEQEDYAPSCNIGVFRSRNTIQVCRISTRFHLVDVMNFQEKLKDPDERKTLVKYLNKRDDFTLIDKENGEKSLEIPSEKYEKTPLTAIEKEEMLKLEILVQEKFTQLEEYIGELKKNLHIGHAYPGIKLDNAYLMITYAYPSNQISFEEVVEYLFSEFHDTIAKIDEELLGTTSHDRIEKLVDEKLICIADLYQKLEWVHPFKDGQGRTDMQKLAELLAANGFNPAILDEPYVSSYATLKDWTTYLKQGIQKWKELAYALEKNTGIS